MKQFVGIIFIVCGIIGFIRFIPTCHGMWEFIGGLIGVGLISGLPAYSCFRSPSSNKKVDGKTWENPDKEKMTHTMEQEVDPIFEAISPKEMATTFPQPIHGNYATLKDELLEKCNPRYFMHPYNHDKIEIANSIYPHIIECKDNDLDQLKALRLQAIEKLEVRFATETIYQDLRNSCNPSRFSNKYNYNAEKVKIANDLLQVIQENADNIIVLENVLKKVKDSGLWLENSNQPSNDKDEVGIKDEREAFIIASIIVIFAIIATFFLIVILDK